MFFFYFIAIFTNVMEIQIRQGITIIVPGCRDAAITCWVNEDTDTLMQLKIANFYSVAWPAYFTSIRIDPWDMLNNCSFHLYAQNSVFIAENLPPHPLL